MFTREEITVMKDCMIMCGRKGLFSVYGNEKAIKLVDKIDNYLTKLEDNKPQKYIRELL